ncbi:MAG TPA: pseudouridine synthase [Polyangia bacterium]|nr:pseudouridine synthase [Polyangia bacterium]
MRDVGRAAQEAPEVVHRDERLIAVVKPAGLIVHRGWGLDPVTLTGLVRRLVGLPAVHPVHRLDRGTSGLVLFALDRESAVRLGSAFEAGSVHKRYLALVRGMAPDSAVIDHPLPRREGGPRVPARTAVRRLADAPTEPRGSSLVEVCPDTGRPHQVRRHLKHLDHPVIGDANWGKGPLNREFRERYGLARMALHAAGLAFDHPFTQARLSLRAPLPPDLAGPLARMGFDPAVWE